MGDDWKKEMEDAADAAAAKADGATQDELEKITRHSDQLAAIVKELKLNDEATYDRLIAIVDEATRKNEAIASVIDRVKALGEAGAKLAGTIGGIASGGGGLAAVKAAISRLG